MIINPQMVEIGKIVKEVVELLKENAQAKNLMLENLVEENIVLEADENMLHSIIRNLLANAIKSSNKGGSILLSTKVSPPYVKLIVADQGVGMSRAIQDKLFRLDVKHSSLGTCEEKGTGLGLLLCKEFAEMHRGWTDVESEQGKEAI